MRKWLTVQGDYNVFSSRGVERVQPHGKCANNVKYFPAKLNYKKSNYSAKTLSSTSISQKRIFTSVTLETVQGTMQ